MKKPAFHPWPIMAVILLFLLAARLAAAGRGARIENELGQLFIVNVDGFSYQGTLAVHPDFMDMVGRLQVGGVIPHYGTFDFQKIKATNRALAGLTRLPLLVCADIVGLQCRAAEGAGAKTARFGDGYSGGFIGQFKDLSDGDFRTLGALNAFALAAVGVNTELGPTIDDSTGFSPTEERARIVVEQLRRFGIEPVLKHFPFLPAGANLHRESPDTRAPLEEVKRRVAIFRALGKESSILMTTHLNDSAIDRDIVTFSPPWRGLLNRETGFDGLVMSDGLLMLKNYAGSKALGGYTATGDAGAPSAAAAGGVESWALRAILAGHDFIIVEGSAAVTYRVFKALLDVANGPSETGKKLRERIEQSYARIAAFKKARKALLTRLADVSPETMRTVISLASEKTGSTGPRFDVGALFLLRPALERAAAR
jgi:beta-glucosidase-like glycosyl hydrolase